MNNQEDTLLKVCKKLSKKYKSRQEQEDLYHEGIVKCLELVFEANELGEELTEVDFYNVARRAMGDYYNISLKPVAVPKSGKAYSALANLKRDNMPDNLTGTERLLYAALSGETDSVDENTLKNTPEQKFIDSDTVSKALNIIVNTELLSQVEAEVLFGVFYEGKSIQDMADILGVSRVTSNQYYRKGLAKLQKSLV